VATGARGAVDVGTNVEKKGYGGIQNESGGAEKIFNLEGDVRLILSILHPCKASLAFSASWV